MEDRTKTAAEAVAAFLRLNPGYELAPGSIHLLPGEPREHGPVVRVGADIYLDRAGRRVVDPDDPPDVWEGLPDEADVLAYIREQQAKE